MTAEEFARKHVGKRVTHKNEFFDGDGIVVGWDREDDQAVVETVDGSHRNPGFQYCEFLMPVRADRYYWLVEFDNLVLVEPSPVRLDLKAWRSLGCARCGGAKRNGPYWCRKCLPFPTQDEFNYCTLAVHNAPLSAIAALVYADRVEYEYETAGKVEYRSLHLAAGDSPAPSQPIPECPSTPTPAELAYRGLSLQQWRMEVE